MNESKERALVLFSGGQDSTTCLIWALERYNSVHTLGIDYRQRHRVELQQRGILRERLAHMRPYWGERLAGDHLVDLSLLSDLSTTAMTHEIAITDHSEDKMPNTFVPGRNLVFLTVAAILAQQRNIKHLVVGVCETDYSGYPDCRDDTIKSLQVALNLGMDTNLVLHTPLMWLDKAETWKLALDMGGQECVDLIVEHTHTCYLGIRDQRHPWGYGCGTCPACALRKQGFQRFQ